MIRSSAYRSECPHWRLNWPITFGLLKIVDVDPFTTAENTGKGDYQNFDRFNCCGYAQQLKRSKDLNKNGFACFIVDAYHRQ